MFSKAQLHRFFFFAVLGLSVGVSSALAVSDITQKRPGRLVSKINFGEDITRPLARFDMRLKYQDKGDGSSALQNIYRLDYPFQLWRGWQIATRTDLPMVSNNTPGSDNREGDWGIGLGDLLTQWVLASPEKNPVRYVAGLRVIWPSATEQQFGSGKYQLGPGAAISYTPSFLADGSFFNFIWREDFSVGGDRNRKDIHKSVLNPGVSFALPRQCYAMLSPEVEINWVDSGHWFVPFNLTAGKKFGNRMIVSLEWNQALVKQYRNYDWEIEARIGCFF